MDALLYLLGQTFVAFIRNLPLTFVARLGRAGGALAYWLDARHRRVAINNLSLCFGKNQSPRELRAIARENFRRLGENYVSAIKTAFMTPEQMRPHFSFEGAEKIPPYQTSTEPQNVVVVLGHFGNFELYTRFSEYVPHYQTGTTYRGLRQPSLNRLMQSLRERSGCKFFERRSENNALKAALSSTGLLLGLLADQSAGRNGLQLPFLGRPCSTSAAPALFALRYRCPLYTSICYRVGLGRWRIEVGDEIPTHENGEPRSTEAIMLDVNRALEKAVRRDPANWFWVHNRWKTVNAEKRKAESGKAKT